MAIGLVSADGQDGVEQQDALLGPAGELAVLGDVDVEGGLQFFEEVLE